jgi:hypothetical protein
MNWILYLNGIEVKRSESYNSVYNHKLWLEKHYKKSPVKPQHITILPDNHKQNFKRPFRVIVENNRAKIVDNANRFHFSEIKFLMTNFKHIFLQYAKNEIVMLECKLADNHIKIGKIIYEFENLNKSS